LIPVSRTDQTGPMLSFPEDHLKSPVKRDMPESTGRMSGQDKEKKEVNQEDVRESRP
jgi:hypothetical protein